MSPSKRNDGQRWRCSGADGQAAQGCYGGDGGDGTEDAGAGEKADGQVLELRLGTWNVQALGWNVLQLLLGRKAEDVDSDGGNGQRGRGRWVPEAVHLDVLGLTETWWKERHQAWQDESGGRFLCGDRPAEGDRAAGVGLVLDRDIR
eukprot:COSAG05_NODE_1565_length_4539_cov_6.401126_1_plen_147_part_00